MDKIDAHVLGTSVSRMDGSLYGLMQRRQCFFVCLFFFTGFEMDFEMFLLPLKM